MVAREETSVNFTCTAVGFPPPDITWVDANNNVLNTGLEDRITIHSLEPYFRPDGLSMSTSVLELSKIRSLRVHSGNDYSCVASNSIQNKTLGKRRVFTLTVTCKYYILFAVLLLYAFLDT